MSALELQRLLPNVIVIVAIISHAVNEQLIQ